MEIKQGNTILTNLKPFLKENWLKSGFQALTEVQERAIPIILEGQDAIIESPTGTGKTLAYLLPLIERIKLDSKNIQAVILAPSHELVMQIHNEIQVWTKGSEITSAAFIGGANITKQVEKLKSKPQMVVGTPGRILELIKMKKMKVHEVRIIVVDEFDVLIAQEHIDTLKVILKSTLRDRQILFFSATLSSNLDSITKELAINPELIKIQKEAEMSANVEHFYIESEQRDKFDVLRSLAHSQQMRALVFINDIGKLSEVEEKLKYKGVPIAVLVGSNKLERKKSLDSFRKGDIPLLLATDLAARGLDIKGLTHVIHFDLPKDSKQYIHRSGRTGRMGKSGIVISLVTKREESILNKLARELGLNFKEKRLYKGEVVDVKRK